MPDHLLQETCRHIAVMKRYAVALCRDPVRADDLVQEALTRAVEGIAGYRPGAPMLPWLLRIVHNVHVSDRRRRDFHAASLDGLEDVPASGLSAEQQVENAQLLHLLWSLPEDQRAAVSLVCLDELSYAEAAGVLGIPKGTLMSRLARGRAALRAFVDADATTGQKVRLRVVGGSGS